MKPLQLFFVSMALNFACFAQGDPNDIRPAFSTRNDKDFKLYDGFNVQHYNYGYSNDTLYYQFFGKELALPLSLIDFKTAQINEEKKWMTIDKEKIYYLKLKPIKNKHFPGQLAITYGNAGSDEVTFFFPSNEMAENALEFLKEPYQLQSESGSGLTELKFDDEIEKIFGTTGKTTDEGINKILAKKDDTDFEFKPGGSSTSKFKYFLYNDSLWFSGTELYAVVIPFANIDIAKVFTYESGVWKNKDGSKCHEIPVYAKAGKHFGQDFKSLWGADSPMEQQLGGKEITIASLVMPDKEWADKFVAYLKTKAR